jgi:hypothetical protein
MFSAFALTPRRFDRLRGSAGYFPPLVRGLAEIRARLASADQRVVAGVGLALIVSSAALAFVFMPSRDAKPSRAAQPEAMRSTAAPVKIIGAAPRSDNCAEQVWPYIERRCLNHAADQPRANSPAKDGVSSASVSQAERATTGAAPTGDAPAAVAGPQPAPAEDAAKPQATTGHLSLPQAPTGGIGVDGLVVPRGAKPVSPGVRDPAREHAADAWAGHAMERLMLGEPRRRAGRRSDRSRGDRRPPFASPLW